MKKTGGLLTGCVNTFSKTKQEASGLPKWCKTEDDKTKYIEDYYQKEGIMPIFGNLFDTNTSTVNSQ